MARQATCQLARMDRASSWQAACAQLPSVFRDKAEKNLSARNLGEKDFFLLPPVAVLARARVRACDCGARPPSSCAHLAQLRLHFLSPTLTWQHSAKDVFESFAASATRSMIATRFIDARRGELELSLCARAISVLSALQCTCHYASVSNLAQRHKQCTA